MKAYVFVVVKRYDVGPPYLFSVVRDTYAEALKEAIYWFNEGCDLSEIMKVEI